MPCICVWSLFHVASGCCCSNLWDYNKLLILNECLIIHHSDRAGFKKSIRCKSIVYMLCVFWNGVHTSHFNLLHGRGFSSLVTVAMLGEGEVLLHSRRSQRLLKSRGYPFWPFLGADFLSAVVVHPPWLGARAWELFVYGCERSKDSCHIQLFCENNREKVWKSCWVDTFEHRVRGVINSHQVYSYSNPSL